MLLVSAGPVAADAGDAVDVRTAPAADTAAAGIKYA
jgi:hypothetical protein